MKPRVRMTRRPKAETSRSGSLAVSAKMKIAIAATTPMDKTSELKMELLKDAEKRRGDTDKKKPVSM